MAEAEDRLSILHESIITNILSHLSTREVVGLCILSPAWVDMWRGISNLRICDEWIAPKDSPVDVRFLKEGEHFIPFGDRRRHITYVGELFSRVHNVQGLNLRFRDEYDNVSLLNLVVAALQNQEFGRNLTSIIIKFDRKWKMNLMLVTFPNSFRALNNLILEISCQFVLPMDIRLPLLNQLSLKWVTVSSASEILFLRLPLLETFVVTDCIWMVNTVEIHAPVLTYFETCTHKDSEVDGYSIKVFGPNLSNIVSFGKFPERLNIIGSHVNSADIRNRIGTNMLYGRHVQELLKSISTLKELRISSDLVKAVVISNIQLPRFNFLACLTICNPVFVKELLHLLHAAPFVKFLSVGARKKGSAYDYKDTVVPSCIINELEETKLKIFDMEDINIDFFKFLIKEGRNLKRFCVISYSEKVTEEVVQQLFSIPSASIELQFVDVKGKDLKEK